jgi:hypothetical protein
MAIHIRRRELIGALGAATAAWPFAARAQQPAMPAIGYLNLGSPESDTPRLTGLRRGLNEAGYIEGRNLLIEYRWAGNQADRLPALAADLVQLGVAVIVASGPPQALAAKAATTSIPIVFLVGVDPVQLGLVTSLNRPGGNLTGFNGFVGELGDLWQGERGWRGSLSPTVPRIGCGRKTWANSLTRDSVARCCLDQLTLPANLLSIKLLDPSAGHGAFFLPLVPKLVRACRVQKRSYSALQKVFRAYEIDPTVAASLRQKCIKALEENSPKAKSLVRYWIRNEDFQSASTRC